MKIAYVANVRLPTERAHGLQIMKMCEALSLGGAEVRLITPSKKDRDGLGDPFLYYGVKKNFSIEQVRSFDFLRWGSTSGALGYFLDLASFISSLFFRLFFTSMPRDMIIYARDPVLLLPFLWKANMKALEIHNIPKAKSFVFLVKKADRVFVLNRFLKDELIRIGVKSEKIAIVPDAVDLREFDIAISKEEARREVGLPLDKRIIMYTGHLYSWKGAETLAEAALDFGEDYLFVFLGGVDKELEDFKKRFGENKNILVLPFMPRKAVPLYLKAADVLVLPNSAKEKISSHYTSPMKLFEYMASGRPIVASDLPSLREVLKENNCFFAEADNSESFSSTIKRVFFEAENADSRAEKARKDVQNYTWEKRVSLVLQTI